MRVEPLGNTWSNLAYVLVAPLVVWAGDTSGFSVAIAFGLLVLTVGSSMFHFESSKLGGNLDEYGMYCVFFPLTGLALARLYGGAELYFLIWTAGLGAASWFVIRRMDSYNTLGVLGGILLMTIFLLLPLLYAVGIAAVFALAFAVRGPKAPYPLLHGLWHVLTAIGIGLLFVLLHYAHFATQ